MTASRDATYMLRVNLGMRFVYVLRALALVVSTLIVVPIVVVVCLFEQDGKQGYRFAQWWMAFNLWMSGVHVKVRGLENLDSKRQYVFMSNHRSAADIVAVGWALWAFQIRFVAKKELLRVPIFGWGLWALKNIVIDRSNHVQAMRSYAVAGQRIRRGISVVVFPEGTRGVGEELLPFKKGGFMLAMETGTPIVPVAVVGTTAIMAKHSLRIESGEVEVRIGTPIETAGVAFKDRNQIVARVREAIGTLARTPAPQPSSQGSSSS